MRNGSQKAWFLQQLRRVLNALYDPRVLATSPLLPLLVSPHVREPIQARKLREVIARAVEALRPQEATPADSRTWRVYQILRRRYIEQLTQRQVAADLGLSVRQLQREEKLAREVLADYIWHAHELDQKVVPVPSPGEETAPEQRAVSDVTRPPTREEELAQLKATVALRDVRVDQVIAETLDTLHPLIEVLGVSVTRVPESAPAIVETRKPLLRQVFLNLMDVALRAAGGGTLTIEITISSDDAEVLLSAVPGPQVQPFSVADYVEHLSMARRLISYCPGSLNVESRVSAHLRSEGMVTTTSLAATVILPLLRHFTVLAVDDNEDVLLLFERYLTGTPYRFVGTQSAQQAPQIAQQLKPAVIVLDVMMPDQDGWMLLNRLREHPQTHDIPVVVCSILAQRDLAFMLGAAGFIRKPVNRQEFQDVIAQQVAPSAKD